MTSWHWSCLALAITLPVLAQAHHSGAAYDRNQELRVEGVVDSWSWANPHCSLQIQAEDKDGNVVPWIFEALPAGLLVRQGYRRSSFAPGDEVTIVYRPLRDGAPGGSLRGAILGDGTAVGVAASN